MVLTLVALGWLALALVLALVVGGGISLADRRAEAGALQVPLLAAAGEELPLVGGTTSGRR